MIHWETSIPKVSCKNDHCKLTSPASCDYCIKCCAKVEANSCKLKKHNDRRVQMHPTQAINDSVEPYSHLPKSRLLITPPPPPPLVMMGQTHVSMPHLQLYEPPPPLLKVEPSPQVAHHDSYPFKVAQGRVLKRAIAPMSKANLGLTLPLYSQAPSVDHTRSHYLVNSSAIGCCSIKTERPAIKRRRM
jgi:hypothetical protein